MVDTHQHRYDRAPRVIIMNGQKQIGVFARIDQGVTGRCIKEKARPYEESTFILGALSGRVLTDEDEMKKDCARRVHLCA